MDDQGQGTGGVNVSDCVSNCSHFEAHFPFREEEIDQGKGKVIFEEIMEQL